MSFCSDLMDLGSFVFFSVIFILWFAYASSLGSQDDCWSSNNYVFNPYRMKGEITKHKKEFSIRDTFKSSQKSNPLLDFFFFFLFFCWANCHLLKISEICNKRNNIRVDIG